MRFVSKLLRKTAGGTFSLTVAGATAQQAFDDARKEYEQESRGKQGYSGTIAEKRDFIFVDSPPEGVTLGTWCEWILTGEAGTPEPIEQNGKTVYRMKYGPVPEKYAQQVSRYSSQLDDKYGPAGCIKLPGGKFLFFGWAPE